MDQDNKIFFEQDYKGINISTDTIQELLNYLNLCKCLSGEQQILKCTFKQLSDNKFDFNGVSTINGINENRCISGTISIYKNKITIEQNVIRLLGTQPETQVINTKDILVKKNDLIYRKSIISNKEYIDTIEQIKKNHTKY